MGLLRLFKSRNNEQEYTVTDRSGISHIGTNRILGDTSLLDGADKINVTFRGSGNILYLEKGIKHLRNVDIRFSGDNSLVYISKSKTEFTFKIAMEGNAVCFIGPHLYTSKMKPLYATVRQGDHLLIGTDCLFSLAIELDTMRQGGTNHGDILIGDHVWIGQNAKIYGGSVIHSGAVLGAQTVVDGSECSGNACWVTRNSELTKLKDGIVFTKDSMRAVSPESLEKFDNIDPAIMESIIEMTSTDETFELVEKLRQIPTAAGRLKHIKRTASKHVQERAPQLSTYMLWDEDDDNSSAAVVCDNRIIGEFDEAEGNSIVFRGKGNILFIEPGAKMKNCSIIFHYDSSLVYLSKSDRPYHFRIYAHYGSTAYFGQNVRFPKKSPVKINLSEAKSVLVGNNVRIGKSVWMRTSDQHPLYDIESGHRINSAKSIVIGNGALIADNTVVRKGSVIASKSGKRPSTIIRVAEEIDNAKGIDDRLNLLKKINNA